MNYTASRLVVTDAKRDAYLLGGTNAPSTASCRWPLVETRLGEPMESSPAYDVDLPPAGLFYSRYIAFTRPHVVGSTASTPPVVNECSSLRAPPGAHPV